MWNHAAAWNDEMPFLRGACIYGYFRFIAVRGTCRRGALYSLYTFERKGSRACCPSRPGGLAKFRFAGRSTASAGSSSGRFQSISAGPGSAAICCTAMDTSATSRYTAAAAAPGTIAVGYHAIRHLSAANHRRRWWADLLRDWSLSRRTARPGHSRCAEPPGTAATGKCAGHSEHRCAYTAGTLYADHESETRDQRSA